MALRRKLDPLLALQPDVLVVPECSESDILAAGGSSAFWVGQSRNKGLGVVVYGKHKTSLDPSCNLLWPWFLNIRVGNVRLMAVWASVKSNQWRYVRVAHQMLDCSEAFLAAPRAVAIGDFNSNAIFDRKHAAFTHTRMVERFAELDMRSLYHHQGGEPHGEESVPTHYLYRHQNKPFHLDYAFVSKRLATRSTLTIGATEEWLSLSDHVPLILDLG
ncbi:MAG: endonuclease/exonuclease/phosphatase family protein [Thermomicrobiales bacterium]|nr:endonuclease/exonuclease/phosphatase family protein [Thermomicrobiales bacterium]